MYLEKTIGVVIPCYNESTQIGGVLSALPSFIDHVVVVDDHSTDNTVEVVQRLVGPVQGGGEIHLVQRATNGGPGAAVAVGFARCLELGVEVVAVVDGDGQMSPEDLPKLIDPVASGQADYAKANRLVFKESWQIIPRHRYLGNALLSMLTKIASGYWRVADAQTGFIALSAEAIAGLDLDKLYGGYGYPNDLLVRLNVQDCRVMEVPSRPIYHVGEQSKMRMMRVIPTISWLISRRFCWRMWHKYVIRDFHPLVLFYSAAAILSLFGLILFVRMMVVWVFYNHIPPINAMMWVFCQITALQLALFAMWFDMEANRHLQRS